MRPAKISQFMKWRDAQAAYQEALRRVLLCADEAERLESQGIEDEEVEDRWRQAREALIAVEARLIVEWDSQH